MAYGDRLKLFRLAYFFQQLKGIRLVGSLFAKLVILTFYT